MKWLTPEQYAEIMQVSVERAQQWCRDGVIRARKVGRLWRIHPGEVE